MKTFITIKDTDGTVREIEVLSVRTVEDTEPEAVEPAVAPCPAPAEPEPVGITLSATDGEANRDTLNRLLSEGDVTLTAGDYPLAPGVIVDGATLNLGGAHLTSTETRSAVPLFWMLGESPCIRDGWMSGNYAAAPGDDGYVSFEGESAIHVVHGGFTGAVIAGVKINNFCGFSVCPEWSAEHCAVQRSPDKAVPVTDGRTVLTFPLTRADLPYITARHAVGYSYHIADSEVLYSFIGKNGAAVGEASGIPGEAVLKPDGAVSVRVSVPCSEYVRYGLYEYRHDNSLTVRGCEFFCNQRLGIANPVGRTVIEDCYSHDNGYPRETHDGLRWDSSTSGFLDIEDIQTPVCVVERCRSERENLGVASRSYRLTVKDCPGLPVRIYGGWTVDADSGTVSFANADAALSVTCTGGAKPASDVVPDGNSRSRLTVVNPVLPLTETGDTPVYILCTFKPGAAWTLGYGGRVRGAFMGCTFDLSYDFLKTYRPVDLTFLDCTFRLNGHTLIASEAAGTAAFTRCRFDDTKSIQAPGSAGFKINLKNCEETKNG